jgi:hypothetical protein
MKLYLCTAIPQITGFIFLELSNIFPLPKMATFVPLTYKTRFGIKMVPQSVFGERSLEHWSKLIAKMVKPGVSMPTFSFGGIQ